MTKCSFMHYVMFIYMNYRFIQAKYFKFRCSLVSYSTQLQSTITPNGLLSSSSLICLCVYNQTVKQEIIAFPDITLSNTDSITASFNGLTSFECNNFICIKNNFLSAVSMVPHTKTARVYVWHKTVF